jgi:hypothetical protein
MSTKIDRRQDGGGISKPYIDVAKWSQVTLISGSAWLSAAAASMVGPPLLDES